MNNKPTIQVAKTAGFCFGVNRAVEMVTKLAKQGNAVATLGPIIHNKQVVDDLKKIGVSICDDVQHALKDTTLVIRSHGVPKSVYDVLSEKQISYIDATCPFVEKIH